MYCILRFAEIIKQRGHTAVSSIMLKEAILNLHHSPVSPLSLLSCFGHEFPLGLGESGAHSCLSKCLDMFLLLMKRVFGRIIIHHLASGRGRELFGSGGELKKVDLELLDCAWLMYHRAWRSTSTTASTSTSANNNRVDNDSMASGRSLGSDTLSGAKSSTATTLCTTSSMEMIQLHNFSPPLHLPPVLIEIVKPFPFCIFSMVIISMSMNDTIS